MDNFLKQFPPKFNHNQDVSTRQFTFGRYKGETYLHVYETDKDYVRFVVTLADEKYYGAVKAYYIELIEEQYGDTKKQNLFTIASKELKRKSKSITHS
jgi:hypothetical protein